MEATEKVHVVYQRHPISIYRDRVAFLF